MRECFRIPYPNRAEDKKLWNERYGTNAYWSGKHYSKRAQDARYWHGLTVSAINRAKIRKRPFDKPVVITFLWNDRMDLDNHSMMAKMILDGMKDKLINDDSKKWVKGIEHYWHEEDCIKVIITEVDGDAD